jgi:hypothetical protein
LNFPTSSETKMACVSIALCSLHNIVTLFHTISMCPPFSCPPSPCWLGYTTRGPRKSPLLSPLPLPRTFRPSPCTWSKVEQLPPPESVTCPPLSVPHSPIDWYTCVRTIQLRWAMTSAKHFGIFLCLTALGIDTNLVPSYYDIYTLYLFITCEEIQTSSANLRPFVKDGIAPYNSYHFSALSTTYFCASLVKT